MLLPVLVELRERGADIVDEQLGEFFVRLDDEAEKFAVVVVYNISKFFLKWKRLEFLPILSFCL